MVSIHSECTPSSIEICRFVEESKIEEHYFLFDLLFHSIHCTNVHLPCLLLLLALVTCKITAIKSSNPRRANCSTKARLVVRVRFILFTPSFYSYYYYYGQYFYCCVCCRGNVVSRRRWFSKIAEESVFRYVFVRLQSWQETFANNNSPSRRLC